MTRVRSIDRGAASAVLVLVLLGADVTLAQTPVSKVSLTVITGDGREPTAGALYKVVSDSRAYVADIAIDGNVSKPLICNAGDVFEAEAESALNRPVVPNRRACATTLAFNFKRALLFTAGSEVLGAEIFGGKATAFSNYATIFARTGQTEAAIASSDAAIAATSAQWLGDLKLDKYVVRDPSQAYRLVFSSDGVAALKKKQLASGLKPTGKLDAATQAAIEAMTQPSNPSKATSALRCVVKDGTLADTVVCAPHEAYKFDLTNTVLIGLQKKPAVAWLPAYATY
jgi:hypothetical protein